MVRISVKEYKMSRILTKTKEIENQYIIAIFTNMIL